MTYHRAILAYCNKQLISRLYKLNTAGIVTPLRVHEQKRPVTYIKRGNNNKYSVSFYLSNSNNNMRLTLSIKAEKADNEQELTFTQPDYLDTGHCS